jgi:hypothetical protein
MIGSICLLNPVADVNMHDATPVSTMCSASTSTLSPLVSTQEGIILEGMALLADKKRGRKGGRKKGGKGGREKGREKELLLVLVLVLMKVSCL